MLKRVALALGTVALIGLEGAPIGTAAAAGGTWTQLHSPVSPPARERAGMATGADGQTVVLFGGEGNAGLLDDTWVLDGAAWAQRRPTTSPPARAGGAMAGDTARGTVVLFGGSGAHGALDDTWIWDGTTWTEQHPTARPAPRADPVLAFDSASGRMLLFGGVDAHGSFLNDTWTWTAADCEQASLTTV